MIRVNDVVEAIEDSRNRVIPRYRDAGCMLITRLQASDRVLLSKSLAGLLIAFDCL